MQAQETLMTFRRHTESFLPLILSFFSGFFKTGRKTKKMKLVFTINPDKYWQSAPPYAKLLWRKLTFDTPCQRKTKSESKGEQSS